jgi:hypothetical protein
MTTLIVEPVTSPTAPLAADAAELVALAPAPWANKHAHWQGPVPADVDLLAILADFSGPLAGQLVGTVLDGLVFSEGEEALASEFVDVDGGVAFEEAFGGDAIVLEAVSEAEATCHKPVRQARLRREGKGLVG